MTRNKRRYVKNVESRKNEANKCRQVMLISLAGLCVPVRTKGQVKDWS